MLFFTGHAFGQAANLVVDSLQGEVTQNEVDTYISYINGGVGGAALPTNALGDNLAFGTPGSTLEGLNYMYRIAGDLGLATEQMQLMNQAIVWSERFILLRNDQAMGPHQVMWTGNVDPVWVTYASTSTEAGYAGSENGDTAGHILYTALNILQTPSIWNQTVPDGNPNGFGATYLQRAQTYINMMEYTTQNYFTRYFINPATNQIVPPSSAVWAAFGENMDAWNRQFLLTNDYLRLAQCHAILGDNPTLQALYTNIVKTSTDAFVANVQLVTAYGEAAYDWGYGNEGDLLGQITGESASHASYDMQGIARVFEAGPAYTGSSLEEMERYANTVEYVMFNYQAYAANQTTAYYKTTDAGLPPVAAGTATQDYLYPQFYFLTPYNTLFWAPAAYGAGIHNNFHNNPYMTAGILYSKHWVYNHTQSLISVASNTQTVTAGGLATYTVTTTSNSPVSLSVSGLPSGATASFDNPSITSGTTATLTVTTGAAAINGSSLFTLTGTSGSSVQVLGLSVVITAPDFTIGLSSTSTINAGNNGSFTVTIKPVNGFTGDVSLAADSILLEPGTTVTFNPPVITGGSGTSSVTAATLTTTPGGQWPFGVIATSGATSHEGYSRLTLKASAQSITFPAIPNVVYGTAPIQLQATAGSNLPVTYTVTGPAVITGSPTLQGQTLTITGAGTVTVTASQAGNTYSSAATLVVQSFTVAPATLTVTAQNMSKAYGAAIPALTANITGFVNGDTVTAISGSPALSTTATSTSPVGTYTITPALGTLAATNYTFVFVNGVLDIYGGRR
jgi:MBG domain (YGX type)